MTHLTRRLKYFAFAALAIVTAACETTNFAKPPGSAELKPGEGVVVLSITGNTGQVGQLNAVHLRREVEAGKPGNVQILNNVAVGLARDTSLFIGNVPAGVYTLEQVTVGTLYMSFGGNASGLMGKIRVEPGTVADLGRLIMTPANGRILTGRSSISTSNVELINRFSPQNGGVLSRTVQSGWMTTPNNSDLPEKHALARPVGADTPVELPSGEVLAASRLGSLLIRNPDGQWRVARTGKLESLLSVSVVNGGKVDGEDAVAVAVGEFNTLVRLDSKWQLQPLSVGNLPPGNIVNIQGDSQSGWFIAHQQGDKAVLYHSAKLNDGDWKAVRTENISFSFWSGARSLWMWRTSKGFAYAVSDGRIHHYDLAAKSWAEFKSPKNHKFITIAPSGDSVGALTSPGGGFGGMFASIFVSADCGATWQEVKSPYNVKMYAPRLLPNGTILMTGGGMYSKEELQSSTDYGKTWKLISSKVGFEENIVPLPTKGLLAINPGLSFGFASIQHSADNGVTWETEFSNFDRELYELEQSKKK